MQLVCSKSARIFNLGCIKPKLGDISIFEGFLSFSNRKKISLGDVKPKLRDISILQGFYRFLTVKRGEIVLENLGDNTSIGGGRGGVR